MKRKSFEGSMIKEELLSSSILVVCYGNFESYMYRQ